MLWSTRINSSRHVSGRETVWFTAGKPACVVFAVGIRESSACPTGSMGTRSPGYGLPVAGLTGQSLGAAAHVLLKSPVRSRSEGTFGGGERVKGFFSRRHSCDQKKNVLFLFEL